jgi:hypothetical protein
VWQRTSSSAVSGFSGAIEARQGIILGKSGARMREQSPDNAGISPHRRNIRGS